jgi:2,3-bisphosphoglycerate-independent phosphoglycerate mutase
LLLLDGIGDQAYGALGGLTPLQAARTPHLDRVAERGCSGLYHAGEVGQALPSETAHFAMFGYGPEDFPGRGALEALGAGIDLCPADVAILTHFVTLRDEEGVLFLQEDKVSLTAEEQVAFASAVGCYEERGVRVGFRPIRGGYGVLVLSGDASPFVTDTNPMAEGRALSQVSPWRTHEEDLAAVRTARALRSYLSWAHRRLAVHPLNVARTNRGLPPANGLVTQRPGRLGAVVPFQERTGMAAATLASGVIYWGIGTFLGFRVHRVQDSEDPGADLANRLRRAREILADFDFVHVHTKAPDEAGHRKDPAGKVAAIEALDRGLGEVLDQLLAVPDLLLVVTADHCTPSGGPLIHSGETVPLTFLGPGVRRDQVQTFDEVSAARGALGCVRGRELLWLILNHTDRAKLQTIMDTPEDQPFWPGRYEPFRLVE